ncbi:MAG: DUF362 domain-containing protein [Clostridia bacterium]|nr:DUF362 domain-containing protein [Clostridia bacterium]
MAKVSVLGCNEYNYKDLYHTLKQSIADLGGLEAYLESGKRVLLKVNLLMKRRPEEATTTHPLFVKALADILVEYGMEVVIGDSPGGPFNEKALKGIYEVCGYNEILGPKISLNTNYNGIHVNFDKGKLMKSLDVIEILTQVDYVISVSKLKTHGMTRFTGAVKNMYGTIPGLKKAEYHYTMPEIKTFSEMLVDVCYHANPVLSFMDGIVGMEGAGPSGGDPRQIGVILVSDSPYALDVVACQIVGINPLSVPTIERTIERNLVTQENIQLVSDKIEPYYIDDFNIPNIQGVGLLKNKVPKWMDRIVDYVIKPKPVIDKDKCVGCGECALCCPAQTIEMKKQPVIHMKNCIRCFCCQELCPVKAIEVYRHPIGKKMLKM